MDEKRERQDVGQQKRSAAPIVRGRWYFLMGVFMCVFWRVQTGQSSKQHQEGGARQG